MVLRMHIFITLIIDFVCTRIKLIKTIESQSEKFYINNNTSVSATSHIF